MRNVILALVLLTLLMPSVVVGQTTCAPGLMGHYPPTMLQGSTTYSIGVSSDLQALLPNIQAALDYWNAIFCDYGIMFSLSGTPYGYATITSNPLDDPSIFAMGSYWDATIELNPNYSGSLSNEQLSAALAHELGHVAGFADVNSSYDAACADETVMWFEVGYFNLMRTTVDAFAASCFYEPVPEPGGEEPPPCTDLNCEDDGPESPLIIDIDGNGISTSTREDGVPFDINADGSLDLTGWTVANTDDAFLWTDLNGDGLVNDAGELFGSNTRVGSDTTVAENGFVALASYDTAERGGNGDSRISNRDEIWAHLWLWTDRNHDGISQRTEVQPMQRAGVRELYIDHDAIPIEDLSGNLHLRGTCLVHEQGEGAQLAIRPMHDVFFAFETH
ncbi:MAG: zinc metalloprotease [Thermoanaerobaculia bacterium]